MSVSAIITRSNSPDFRKRLKNTLQTSGEDVEPTLETREEDVKTTLEKSGEDVKTTLEKSGEAQTVLTAISAIPHSPPPPDLPNTFDR